MIVSVKDKKTNRQNKMSKLIEKILNEKLVQEYVWYIIDIDELFVCTPKVLMEQTTMDSFIFGQSLSYVLVGEL